jgi:hypothetical protein
VLSRQRLARLHVPDDPINLGAVQRAFDAQNSGQHDHDIAVGQQQITGSDIAMRDECFYRVLALAEQQGQLTRLPQIIESRPAIVCTG